ncbi:SCO family protein [Marinovum sp. SP66]|uniref:SCO family protein n=1 Tax=Marinovum TaxID=367771 RepID=UPI00237B5C7A|nr:SCO family protein [Marinovum sp. SP66]MDD9738181.1 SCO family protein [Marinovum sp. SP66]
MGRIAALFAGVAVIAFGGVVGYKYFQGDASGDPFAQCRSTAVAGGTDAIGGPFTLINSAGASVTDADVITEPSILYFGYTFCPDVCPLDFARNAQAVDLLAAQGHSATPVFITVDPERDTPEVVGDFAYNNHEKAIGLTGTQEQVQVASRAYRTYYKAQDKSDEYYLVDHSTFSYLVLPEHGFVEYFRRDISPEDMAAHTACFIEAAG